VQARGNSHSAPSSGLPCDMALEFLKQKKNLPTNQNGLKLFWLVKI